MRGLGWTSFRFDWLVDRDMAIYTVVIAAVWQASGFAMALFLAGLRSLDADLYKAAQIDGASPDAHVPADHGAGDVADRHRGARDPPAVRDQDLRARARAHRRRARASRRILPTIVVYDYMFQRGLMGAGSAAAVMLLLSLLVIVVPYAVYRRMRARRVSRHG